MWLVDRWHGRAGNRFAGARSRSQVDRRWRRSTRRSGNGVDSPGYRAALWCPPPRSARECLARGQIQSVRGGPGGGTGVPEGHASSARGPRSRGNDKVSPAQVEAIGKWGVQQKGASDYLKTIKQPTLVVNGSNDVNIPTVNSFIMQQNMPNAQLIIYPDSNHGAHHQYPELFVEHATLFLNAVTTTKEGCTHG